MEGFTQAPFASEKPFFQMKGYYSIFLAETTRSRLWTAMPAGKTGATLFIMETRTVTAAGAICRRQEGSLADLAISIPIAGVMVPGMAMGKRPGLRWRRQVQGGSSKAPRGMGENLTSLKFRVQGGKGEGREQVEGERWKGKRR